MVDKSNLIVKIFGTKIKNMILPLKPSELPANNPMKPLAIPLGEIPSECIRANLLKEAGASLLNNIRSYFETVYNSISEIVDFEQVRRFKSDYYYTQVNEYLRDGEEALRKRFEKRFDKEVNESMSKRQNKDEPYFLPEFLKKFLQVGETMEAVSLKELDARARQSSIDKDIAEIVKIIKGVDKVFENSRIPESTTVYRGVSEDIAQRVVDSGEAFKDKGFISTSYYKNRAKLFGGSHILEIEVPKESKAIDMKTALPHAGWKDWEDELLIPRDSKFEVISYDQQNKIVKLRLADMSGIA